MVSHIFISYASFKGDLDNYLTTRYYYFPPAYTSCIWPHHTTMKDSMKPQIHPVISTGFSLLVLTEYNKENNDLGRNPTFITEKVG